MGFDMMRHTARDEDDTRITDVNCQCHSPSQENWCPPPMVRPHRNLRHTSLPYKFTSKIKFQIPALVSRNDGHVGLYHVWQ
jgi:hypothetical protein